MTASPVAGRQTWQPGCRRAQAVCSSAPGWPPVVDRRDNGAYPGGGRHQPDRGPRADPARPQHYRAPLAQHPAGNPDPIRIRIDPDYRGLRQVFQAPAGRHAVAAADIENRPDFRALRQHSRQVAEKRIKPEFEPGEHARIGLQQPVTVQDALLQGAGPDAVFLFLPEIGLAATAAGAERCRAGSSRCRRAR